MPRGQDDHPTVLVVDDEQLIRWAIQRTLSAAGFDVVVAETAAQGLALFREFSPQVVLLDICLPDQNGLTVLREMKQQSEPQSAVIMMTAFGEDHTASEAAGLGAYDYLKKPFDFDCLAALVARAVGAAPENSAQRIN
jgi:two-component system response regulator AtoC